MEQPKAEPLETQQNTVCEIIYRTQAVRGLPDNQQTSTVHKQTDSGKRGKRPDNGDPTAQDWVEQI